MTRIVLIVRTFPKLSEAFVVSKFLGLVEKGWDVHVVCARSSAAEWAKFTELKRRPEVRRRVAIVWRDRPRWRGALLMPVALVRCLLRAPRTTWCYLRRGWQRFGIDILRRLYLDAELICLAPDLIHFEFGSLTDGRMYLKELLNCKVIVSFRGYDLYHVETENPDYYRDVWDKADALHLLGEDLWRQAQRRGCPPDELHILIPPAIDTKFFDADEERHTEVAGTPARPLRVLSVGRLDWRKGYEYALQAIQLLRSRGIHCEYVIIGDGNYLEPVAFARHQMKLEDAVCLPGAQPHAEIKARLLWADVLLHAAVSEGFSNAVLEAQAATLPVVCTDAGGLPENVVDGETGFVVPARNAHALAEKLSLLACQPELRRRMGRAGRERTTTRFRAENQVADFARLYERVCGTTGAAGGKLESTE